MTAKTKTSVKTFFNTGDKPTEAEFVHLIDSYLDHDATIQAIASAAQGGKTGLVEIVGTANVSGRAMGTVGKLLIATNTTASVTSLLALGPLATISQVSAGVIGANEVTRAKLATGPAGSVLVFDSTGSASVLSGSLGQVLTSQGSSKATFSSVTTVSAATQSDMEAASSTGVYVTPGLQHNHPGMPKAWVTFEGSAAGTTGPCSVKASYNITAVSGVAAGDFLVTFTTNFSNAKYAVMGMCTDDNTGANNAVVVGLADGGTKSVSQCRVTLRQGSDATKVAAENVCLVFFGDQ